MKKHKKKEKRIQYLNDRKKEWVEGEGLTEG